MLSVIKLPVFTHRPPSVLPQLRALDKKANKVEKVKAKKDGEHDRPLLC